MRAPSIIMCIPVSSVSNGGNFLAQLLLSTATHPILQYMMSAEFGHERIEHGNKNGLIKTIPKIPRTLYWSFYLVSFPLLRGHP